MRVCYLEQEAGLQAQWDRMGRQTELKKPESESCTRQFLLHNQQPQISVVKTTGIYDSLEGLQARWGSFAVVSPFSPVK